MGPPGPHAQVYYNEAGEPMGWDNEYSYEPPEPSDEDERRWDAEANAAEEAYEYALDSDASDEDAEELSQFRVRKCKGMNTADSWQDWLRMKLSET